MSFPPQGAGSGGGGVSNLSDLIIDADKNWNLKRIQNIEDGVNPRDVASLRQIPGIPEIEDLIVYITGAVNRAIVVPVMAIPQTTVNLDATAFVATPSSSSPELSIPTPVVSGETQGTSVNDVDGAVSHDNDGVDTDETSEANNDTPDNLTLLQSDGATADWYGLGYSEKFDGVVINISTAGADLSLDTFEYSRGSGAWGVLTPIMNQLNNYSATGKKWFTFEIPSDWAKDDYIGKSLYWIKLKSSATGAGYTQPLGQRAYVLRYEN